MFVDPTNKTIIIPQSIDAALKVSRYGVFSRPNFIVFGLTEIYSVNLRNQSEHKKIWTRKNSVFGHFSRSEMSK